MDKEGTPTSKVEEVVEETEVDTNTEVEEGSVDTNTEVQTPEFSLDYKFLDKDEVITDIEEARTLVQKGRNHDHVKEKADEAVREAATLKQELAELRLQMSEKEIDTGKKELEKRLKDEGYDETQIKEMVEPAFKTTQERIDKEKRQAEQAIVIAKRTAEKEKLKGKRYFKEVEAELDKFISQPSNNGLTLDFAFNQLVGNFVNSSEFENVVKTTKQSAIADYTDKAKRGQSIKADNSTIEEIAIETVLDAEAIKMTKNLGGDVKAIAKYVKDQLTRKG